MKSVNLLYCAIVASVAAGAIAAHVLSVPICVAGRCFAAGGQF